MKPPTPLALLATLPLAALALAATSPAGAQDDEGCRRCEYRGMTPCGAHDEELLELEQTVLFCAVVADCERCGGTLLEDCERCDVGPDHAVAEARRAEVEAWRVRDALEEHMERDLPRIETHQFLLMLDTGELRDGRKKVDPHLLAHYVARDVEAVAASLNEDFRLDREADYAAKMRMWIWNNLEDHQSAMRQFLETVTTGDFKMLGRAPVFSVWTEPSLFDTVPAVRTLFAHNAAHMLLSNALFPLWVGDLGGGWLDAGVGHYYEYEVFERTRNYCIEEATATGNYEDGVWRAAVRKRLDREEDPFLPRLLPMNTGAMEQDQQALCFAFFEYLVHAHGDALRDVLQDLKDKRAPRDVFSKRLGLSVLEAEAAWRAWIEEAYPKRGDDLDPPTEDD